ncbi:hypothetical protein [Mycoplasmopsis felifaucium]|uniref:Uncharacterized protein n=1 Tax=Mycoplasmopsis felifaucium TaxID=35768 RepID=A0ABZ2RQE1_9BACT
MSEIIWNISELTKPFNFSRVSTGVKFEESARIFNAFSSLTRLFLYELIILLRIISAAVAIDATSPAAKTVPPPNGKFTAAKKILQLQYRKISV